MQGRAHDSAAKSGAESVTMKRKARGAYVAAAVCGMQLAIGGVIAVIAGLEGGVQQAKAAFYGGFVAAIPAAYLALRMFRVPADAAPLQLAGAVYRGELGKLLLTALLFWIGVVVFAGEFLSLMFAYITSLSAYWVAMAKLRME